MGLLKVGTPLVFNDSKKHLLHVREHGVTQFLATWNRVKHFEGDELLWGDEIESGIVVIDPITKTAKLSIRAVELRDNLNAREARTGHQVEGATWHPEFGSWMVCKLC